MILYFLHITCGIFGRVGGATAMRLHHSSSGRPRARLAQGPVSHIEDGGHQLGSGAVFSARRYR
eukprot:11476-Amphidinium_carterae.1